MLVAVAELRGSGNVDNTRCRDRLRDSYLHLTLSLPRLVALPLSAYRVPQGRRLLRTCDDVFDLKAATGERGYLAKVINSHRVCVSLKICDLASRPTAALERRAKHANGYSSSSLSRLPRAIHIITACRIALFSMPCLLTKLFILYARSA
jgi:hypothetical protein